MRLLKSRSSDALREQPRMMSEERQRTHSLAPLLCVSAAPEEEMYGGINLRDVLYTVHTWMLYVYYPTYNNGDDAAA